MAYLVLTASYTTGVFEFENGFMMSNTKTQKNPFTLAIEEYGVSGDVAGIIVANLNSGIIKEVQGRSNTQVRNILGINEYTDKEKTELGENVVDRGGSDFYIDGDKMKTSDGNTTLNVRVIRLFMAQKINHFLQGELFEDPDGFSKRFSDVMKDLESSVKRYVSGFAYSYEVTGKTIRVDFREAMNVPISRMKFNIAYNQ